MKVRHKSTGIEVTACTKVSGGFVTDRRLGGGIYLDSDDWESAPVPTDALIEKWVDVTDKCHLVDGVIIGIKEFEIGDVPVGPLKDVATIHDTQRQYYRFRYVEYPYGVKKQVAFLIERREQ